MSVCVYWLVWQCVPGAPAGSVGECSCPAAATQLRIRTKSPRPGHLRHPPHVIYVFRVYSKKKKILNIGSYFKFYTLIL